MANKVYQGTGHRKSSIAKVTMVSGKGKITVNGMLPHNRLGRAMGKKLFVYEEENHPHTAQKPVVIEVK